MISIGDITRATPVAVAEACSHGYLAGRSEWLASAPRYGLESERVFSVRPLRAWDSAFALHPHGQEVGQMLRNTTTRKPRMFARALAALALVLGAGVFSAT